MDPMANILHLKDDTANWSFISLSTLQPVSKLLVDQKSQPRKKFQEVHY